MKKIIAAILAVALVCMLLVSVAEIRDLRQTTQALQNQMLQLDQDLERRVENIEQRVTSRIDDMLQEQQKVFHETSWEYGELDLAGRSAEIFVSVVPKTFDPGKTEVQITLNGESYPLSYEDGAYRGTFERPLFESTKATQLSMTTDGVVQMEQLNWYWDPSTEVLLDIDVYQNGSAAWNRKGGNCLWFPGYGLSIHLRSERPFRVERAELVEVLNGKENGRLPIDLSDESQKAYLEEIRKRGGSVEVSEAVPVDPIPEGMVLSDTIYYKMETQYTVEPDSDLRLYLELEDSSGLIYRRFLVCMQTDDYGNGVELSDADPNSASEEWPALNAVYDRNGNLLASWDWR